MTDLTEQARALVEDHNSSSFATLRYMCGRFEVYHVDHLSRQAFYVFQVGEDSREYVVSISEHGDYYDALEHAARRVREVDAELIASPE